MIKRIVDISEPTYLSTKNKQLLIQKEGKTVGIVPIEDLGVLILQHPAIVITQACIISCQKNKVVIVFCDARHLPYSALLPISDSHTLHSKVFKQQIAVREPTKKRLWQQIVQLKIKEQILTLKHYHKPTQYLERLVLKVKSGDPTNCEAQAAKYYWQALMGSEFRRDTDAEGVNALLNYGYSIMRAMIARAIVSSGLHPALGLFHSNQYNGLCLADDLIEPFRPWVDECVYLILQENNPLEVNQNSKKILLGLLSEPVLWEKQVMPLMVVCHYLTSHLKKAYSNSNVKIRYPKRIKN